MAKRVRPHVICHMCISIDGRILSDRWGNPPGFGGGSSLFETTADSFGIGAWIVGNTTMKEFQGRNLKLKPAKRRVGYDDYIAQPRAKRLAIGADAKGVLRFQESEVDGDHVVLLVTRRVSQDYLAHLQEAGVSYLVCGDREIDLPTALTKLQEAFGLKKLMLEGGGTFNGAMLAAGLVDEVSIVLVPVIDGGVGITGVFDIPGDPPRKAAAHLRLTSQKTMPGGVQWLRYKVIGKAR